MTPADTDTFAEGVRALEAGNASDAILAFEALADRGAVDPNASFDRGLAYALRVRIGAEQPGDLGRAAHGFEEARDLATDRETRTASTHALTIVRGEVARRRARSGDPVEVEQSPPPHVAVARSLEEQTWAGIAIAMACALAIALVVRSGASSARRVRIGATIAFALATLVMAASTWATAIRRSERLGLVEAVVVTPLARPADANGLALQPSTPLPEGARVQVIEQNGGLSRIRWGSVGSDRAAYLPASTLRNLTKAP